ncbi:hypothetical protein F5X96DRAFT_648174 [Biscogniauxia mediterranea]|nr:hypothetical protein F5X96DRAFT_648174 [Biscogniauxia mediterranea]
MMLTTAVVFVLVAMLSVSQRGAVTFMFAFAFAFRFSPLITVSVSVSPPIVPSPIFIPFFRVSPPLSRRGLGPSSLLPPFSLTVPPGTSLVGLIVFLVPRPLLAMGAVVRMAFVMVLRVGGPAPASVSIRKLGHWWLLWDVAECREVTGGDAYTPRFDNNDFGREEVR